MAGWDGIVMAGAAIVAAAMVVWLQSLRQAPAAQTQPGETPSAFLFKQGKLLDMTPAAKAWLGAPVNTVEDFAEFLSLAFPELPLSRLGEEGVNMTTRDGDCRVIARTVSDVTRVEVWGIHQIASMRHAADLALLRNISTYAPHLIWQQTAQGRIVWSNAAFRALASDCGSPPESLFEGLDRVDHKSPRRLQPNGNRSRWFDITSHVADGRITCFGNETTELVRADESRLESVKTMGRTFADLSTGLAIFDKDRQLKMFNPALFAMSGLPIAFLSARPRIDTFLDRMRELQMMPEPKNYSTWREQFTALEVGAKQGTYCENWPLPDGQTYRVTGRPHPDGAFALLFEDITAELSLTRRFRTEIETGQAVLNSLPDALAVFSHSGTLVMTNAAYDALWGYDGQHFEQRDLGTEVALWREGTIASPVWARVSAMARQTAARQQMSGDALLHDGRPLGCHAIPLDGGMTLVRFVQAPSRKPALEAPPQKDATIRASRS